MRRQQDASGVVTSDEIRAVVMDAVAALWANDVTGCASLLQHARALLRRARNHPELAITVEFTQAALARMAGRPEEGLMPALTAANFFTKQKLTANAARAHLFCAEIAMDIAEAAPAEVDRPALLTLVPQHLEEALRLAQEAHDQEQRTVVQLSQVRFSRLDERTPEAARARLRTLQRITQAAEKNTSVPLLAQVYTALADELLSQGSAEDAMRYYRRTLEVLKDSEARFLSVPATRALHLYHEQHPETPETDATLPDEPPAAEQD